MINKKLYDIHQYLDKHNPTLRFGITNNSATSGPWVWTIARCPCGKWFKYFGKTEGALASSHELFIGCVWNILDKAMQSDLMQYLKDNNAVAYNDMLEEIKMKNHIDTKEWKAKRL